MDIPHLTSPATLGTWKPVGPPLLTTPRSPAGAHPPVGPSLAAVSDSYLANRSQEALKASAPNPDAVKVAVHRRDDGVTMITLYDTRTGGVIASLPPEAVIKAIDEALESVHEQPVDQPAIGKHKDQRS